MFNRSQIHTLGKRIREAYSVNPDTVSEEDLRLLQDYRTSYKETIAEVFKILHAVGVRVDKKGIITYRIKRLNSIMRKLSRYPDMPLDRLVDIAGCRCIVQTEKQVYEVFELLKQSDKLNFDVEKDVKDYILHPQKEGYKSLHVYVSLKDDKTKRVEIQIRDRQMHNWATLLEISDTIIDGAKLKEYSQPEDLLEFHRILSHPMSEWTNEEKKHFFEVLKKYDYINQLNNIFVKNIDIQYRWMTSSGSRLKTFYLIQYDDKYKTKISSYQSFKEAEDAYFKCFVEDGNSNVVLTQIQDATYDQISVAYSNYVLSTHQLIDDIMAKLMKEIKTSVDHRDIDSYSYYLDIYFNALYNLVLFLREQSNTLSLEYQTQKIQQSKANDCIMDIRKRNAHLRSKANEILTYYREISNHFSFFYFRIKRITRRIAKQNNFHLK